MEERKRERRAFGPGFLPKETISEEERAANEAAVEQLAQQEGEGEVLVSRQHPSDISKDVKSLDRKGQRNLYLLVQVSENGKDVWRFPQGPLAKGLLLHQVSHFLYLRSNSISNRLYRTHRQACSRNVGTTWTPGLSDEYLSAITSLLSLPNHQKSHPKM